MKQASKYLLFVFPLFSFTNGNSQTIQFDATGNKKVFDDRGRLVEYQVLDSEGKLRGGGQLARKIYSYDSLGNLVIEAFQKADHRPHQYPNGVSKRYYHRDYKNARVVIENLDSMGRRTVDSDTGLALVCYQYDKSQRLIESLFFDQDSLLTANSDGDTRVALEYENGVVNEFHYGIDGHLKRIVDRDSKYLSSLQLYHLPHWLKYAKQYNRVDGVTVTGLRYDLILKIPPYSGHVELRIDTIDGDVHSKEVVSAEGMKGAVIKRFTKAIKQARFMSLSNEKEKSFNGIVSLTLVPDY